MHQLGLFLELFQFDGETEVPAFRYAYRSQMCALSITCIRVNDQEVRKYVLTMLRK